MHISEEHIDLYERFYQQQLSEKEIREFEARLVYDKEFSEQFEQYKQIEQGVRDHYRNEMKQRFLSIDEEMDHKPIEKHLVKKKWLVFVAAALVVIIFSIYKGNQKSESRQLALNYWPVEPGLPVKMSSKGRFDDAMNAYKLGEVDEAAELLVSIDSDTSDYFLGVIAFEENEFESARGFFGKIESSSFFFDEGQFRLALVYITFGEFKAASEIFQLQVDRKTEFASASKELLSKI